MESCDVCLEERERTCDEEGIDGGYLVVESFFHAFRGVEYEDSWGGLTSIIRETSCLIWMGLTQTERGNVIW